MVKILVVDDEEDIEPLMLQKFRHRIRSQEYEFFFALNGVRAIEKIQEHPDIDLIISDINMPEMDGLTLLQHLMTLNPNLKAIVVSAYGDMQNIRAAMNRGAFDFVTKPVNFEDLQNTIERALEHLAVLKAGLEVRTKLIAINQELHVASSLQQAILPKKFPDDPSLQLYAVMQPATEVAGDFYDFFWIDADHLGIVVADVSGKGITAALFMAVSRTLLKAIAPYCQGPGECLQKVNYELSLDNDTAMFVTVFYGVLSLKDGRFTYANGGHCQPVYLGKNDKISLLDLTQGVALGVFEEATFAETTVTLSPDETLFLYTDGVSEAMNTQNEEFTVDRILRSFDQHKNLNMEGIIEQALGHVKDFVQEAVQSDDITCLAIKYLGGSYRGK